jgi:hypothetical protein
MKPTTAEIHRALYGSAGKGNWNGETQLVKSIQAYLRLIGCPSFRRNVGALEVADAGGKRRMVRFASPGQADLWFIAPGGVHGEIEAKQPGLGKRSEPTPQQQEWLDAMRKAGAIALTVTSLEELAERLEIEFRVRGLVWREDWRIR